MRDLFSPLFLLTLLCLFFCHANNIHGAILIPLFWLAGALSLAGFVLKKYFFSYVFIALAFSLLISFSFGRYREQYDEACAGRWPLSEYVTISGKLGDYPEIGADATILLVRAEVLSWRGQDRPVGMNVRIKVKGVGMRLNRGDQIQVDAQLFPNSLSENFFPNRFRDYLLCRQIHAQGISKSTQLIRMQKRAGKIWEAIGFWRESIRGLIEKKYHTAGVLARQGVFLQAILLGERGQLDVRIEEELIRSGVLHIIAISGANIGIITIFCLWVFKLSGIRLRWRYLLTSLILLIFLSLSGFDVSAQRAVCMALLIFSAKLFFREFVITNMIALSGMVMLVLNPSYFLDPGFILTYALTYSLVFGRRIFAIFDRRKSNFARELVKANFSAVAMAMALSFYYFSRFSLAGIFSGLVLVPLSGLITAGGLLLIPCSLVWQPIGAAVLLSLHPLLTLFFTITSWISGWHWDLFRPGPPLPFVFLIFLIYAFLAWEPLPKKAFFGLSVLFVILQLLVLRSPEAYRPTRLEAYFLDVGQGDCQVVVFPQGDALLVDGGGSFLSDFQVGKRLVLPFLLQKGIRIRWAALTHYHPDHAAGFIEIISIIKPEQVWIGSAPSEEPRFHELMQAAPPGCRVLHVSRGFHVAGSGCTIEVLYPGHFIEDERTGNNDSLVLKVTDGKHTFLFMGDCEAGAEMKIVSVSKEQLLADVIKIGHHGSANATSFDLLRTVKPRLAVISYRENNSFGFPHATVLANLKRFAVPWLGTARRGGIRIRSEDDGLSLEVSK